MYACVRSLILRFVLKYKNEQFTNGDNNTFCMNKSNEEMLI